MTIPSTTRKAGPLLGTGSQTAWPFTFKVFAVGDVAVTIADAIGVETTLVLDTDYSVSLNANQDTSPGGTVTYPISGTPLATGSVLTIAGDLDYDQPLAVPTGGNFNPTTMERQLDRMVMQIQQLKEQLGRTLQVGVTSDANATLPAPVASNILGWDATASALENYPLSELATAIAFATYRYDTFAGDGVEDTFALAADPVSLGNIDVSVDGITFVPGVDHTLVGTSLVFTTPPTAGVEILARYGQGLPPAALGSASDISFSPAGGGAVTRTVEQKLRDMPGSAGDYGTPAQGYTAGGMFSPVDGGDSSTWLWTRKLTGAHAIGAGTLTGFTSGYHFDILTDDADVGADFMVGFRVRHLFGGAATKGGREALSGAAWLTAATHASNANRNYVAVQGKALAQSGDNGTNTGAGALGAIFGVGGAAYAYAAATNLLGIEGAEFNTFTESGSSAKHMVGISVVGCQSTRGAVIDAAIRIGAQAAVGVFGPHIGWKHGIIFTDENGADPFYSSSTLIGTQFQVVKTILRGIDLSQFNMTEYILRGVYSKLTESALTLGDTAGFAQVDIVGASANASLLLRSRGTGSVYMGGSDGTYSFRADRVASAVNYVATTPAVTGGSPAITGLGSDANVDLQLQGKGTGLVRFGTHTGGGDTVSNGYITIRDAAGNTRKLMTTA